jgi:hypothetical protein
MDFKKPLTLQQEYLALLLLNLFDLFLTGWIFRQGGHESNRLANVIMAHFKLAGLAVYKVASVAVIIVLSEIVAQKHKETAVRLVMATCLFYLFLVCYECYGIMRYMASIPVGELSNSLFIPLFGLSSWFANPSLQ